MGQTRSNHADVGVLVQAAILYLAKNDQCACSDAGGDVLHSLFGLNESLGAMGGKGQGHDGCTCAMEWDWAVDPK